MMRSVLGAAMALAVMAGPGVALEPSWPDLRDALYGDQFLREAGRLITSALEASKLGGSL